MLKDEIKKKIKKKILESILVNLSNLQLESIQKNYKA
jgi:hypothetical protein